MTRTRAEMEAEVYRTLSRMYEFPVIKAALEKYQGDIDKTMDLVYKENSWFCIFSGSCGRGSYDHEVSLLKSGYFTLWVPENDDIMNRKPYFKLNIKEIFKLIRNGPSTQMVLFQ